MNTQRVKMPLREATTKIELGAVPETTGRPSYVPTPDQLPLAYDASSGVLYFYTGEWRPFGLNALTEVNLGNLTNLDNVVGIPVRYNSGTQQVEGYISLKELKSLINGR